MKRCPHCGEYVHTNDLTCRKCYGTLPREPEKSPEYVINEEREKKTKKVPSAAVLLAIIPPFFGLLGLGMIYVDHKNSKGYWFLVAGLILFVPFTVLFFIMGRSGLLSAILLFIPLVIIFLIYASAAVAALVETVFGSVFKVLRF